MGKLIEALRRSIYEKVIKRHLDDMPGNWVEVGDYGGEISVATKSVSEACDEIQAYADSATVALYCDVKELGGPVRMGWFLVIHGHEPEETIADWSANQYMGDLIEDENPERLNKPWDQ